MSGCPFCAIVAAVIAGDRTDVGIHPQEAGADAVLSFEPLNPVVPGHRLFIPALHVRDAAADAVITARVMRQAALHARYAGAAFNLITSAGAAATQTVPHFHTHYVPRAEGDGLALPWTGQKENA